MPHGPLIIDISGTELTALDRRRLSHPLVGGLILFSRNGSSRKQLTHLCAEIRQLRHDLLICVDHEGGRVQRFREDGFTRLPSMRSLGPNGRQAAAGQLENQLTACGYILASELRACGVDFSFAPVLDLDWGASTVIGDRALAREPETVAVLARSLILGMAQAGMAHCGKHFPGHGFVAADSHVDIPRDTRSLQEIMQADAMPYAYLKSCLLAIMPAHVIYPQVDDLPAGFSSRWLRDILRGQLAFDGAIISDDLSMAGARQILGQTIAPSAAVLAALKAGCDAVLLCNQSLGQGRVIDEVLDALQQALDTGAWQPDPQSRERLDSLRPGRAALTWTDMQAQWQYQRAQRILAGSANEL